MPRGGSDTKARILAVERILKSATKPLLCPEIQDILYSKYNIEVERKTLLDDLNVLTLFYNVVYKHKIGYYIEKLWGVDNA